MVQQQRLGGAVTVTRHSLVKCRTKGCPFTPDQHDEWMELCSRAPEHGHRHDQPSHQHWPKRSQGGKEIVAVLCWPFHDRVDNGDFGNDVKEVPGRGRVYFAWDIHGNTLIEREVMPSDLRTPNSDQREVGRESGLVLSAAAEAVKSGSIIRSDRGDEGKADPTLPRGSEGAMKPDSVAAHTSAAAPSAEQSKEESEIISPPTSQRRRAPKGGSTSSTGRAGNQHVDDTTPLSTKEESDADTSVPRGPDRGDSGGTVVGDSDSVPLTHEQRCAIAQAIRDTEWNRQWFAGDTGNLWIEQLGESAEQYLSDFGYQPESLANILRVCAAIKPAYRNVNLRFSHHVVVYDQPPEDRMRWLAECEENQWSVAEFRRQVKGTKPRVKRWSLEELRELGQQFMRETALGEGESYLAGDFLDWLGKS
ncbi:hypothetical protein LCGC14_2331060 [marine sediment metagenome]|uniref:Uncharacterized protein n=1 Tax=marine sediment metagenome TaxID=412755 RepID=A0A0F9CFJ9_9ZZZZ